MNQKRILIISEDPRSTKALVRDISANLHLSASQIDCASSPAEACAVMIAHEYAVVVVISEEESVEARAALEQFCLNCTWPTIFVNLRPGFIPDASVRRVPCTLFMGPETRVDHVRRAVKRFLADAKEKKDRGGWR